MKKSFSFVLALCMVLSLFATLVLPAAAEDASPVADGDNVVIYCPEANLAISAEEDVYKDNYRLAGTEKENGAVFTVDVTDDGIYFICDGKYLTSGETGSNLTLEAEANEYSLWVLEEAENGWYIKNVNAVYNNTKPQYIEYYYAFTTYSLNTSNAGIFTFQFIAQEDDEDGKTPVDDTLTIEEAIALGQTMEHNTFTEEKYYVTGVITSVYETTYGNMYIEDENGNRLTIYGTYSEDGSTRYDAMEVKPVKGDTVTIYGSVGRYNSASQIKNGWIVNHVPGEGEDDEEVVPDPAADSVLTIAEAIALGASKDHNNYTANKYYVTGVITEIYNDQYGNMRITDEGGNILTIYGTYSADGSTRYDAMEVKPAVGDTVTIYGIIGQFNDVAQVKNGWITAINPEIEGDESDTSDGEGDVSDTSDGEGTPELGDASIAVVAVVMLAAMAGVAVVYRRRRA